MSMFQGESQEGKEAVENLIRSQRSDTGSFVDSTGDTMTGDLIVPTVSATSLVSAARIETTAMVLSSLVSARRVDTPRIDVAGGLNALSMASLAQVGGSLDVRANGAVPTLDLAVSGASGTVLKVGNIERGYVSTNSAASMSFAIRIDIGGTIYYMPVYLAAA